MSEQPRTFDRIPKFDERSKAYPMRELLDGLKARSYSWRHLQLDQGQEGACTGFAVTMEAAARPKPVFGDPVNTKFTKDEVAHINDVARSVYHRARQLDEWPGEDYEGSSVIAAVKAGVERGWWNEYRWALGPGAEAAADDVIRMVGHHGPVIMGTTWWSGMLNADADEYLHVTGEPVGGHAWLITKYNAKRDAVWTPNSWGGDGQGWITRADLVKLLADSGEACVVLVRENPEVEAPGLTIVIELPRPASRLPRSRSRRIPMTRPF